MFAKFAAPFVAVALATGVMSSPVAYKSGSALVARGPYYSFNGWGGYSSLDNFDSFYGAYDYAHQSYDTVVVQQDNELVCHSETVTIIQQRLAVLQEMAKKIITEQICEVETQTIVFQQYYASLGGFSKDLTRSSGRSVGYDNSISSYYGDFYNSDGSLSNYDFGFNGSDVGSNYYVPTGNNWDANSSPSSVGSAYQAAQSASSYYY
ncbi:hypothetical protein DFH07DRAFT_1066536 [Mycena maculata]|uniref:Uncharacterized protein n=1 Tax=Mycena maculata TaxID=230809 RepID=A0AAD7HSP8_9AGAR|nr:hypothetical protein DFH07DRAFT_1066536 [Mycena maculata]